MNKTVILHSFEKKKKNLTSSCDSHKTPVQNTDIFIKTCSGQIPDNLTEQSHRFMTSWFQRAIVVSFPQTFYHQNCSVVFPHLTNGHINTITGL